MPNPWGRRSNERLASGRDAVAVEEHGGELSGVLVAPGESGAQAVGPGLQWGLQWAPTTSGGLGVGMCPWSGHEKVRPTCGTEMRSSSRSWQQVSQTGEEAFINGLLTERLSHMLIA